MSVSQVGDVRSVGTDRRGLSIAIVGCIAAAAAMLLGSGQTWLRAELPAQPPLPGVSNTFSGGDIVRMLVPIGILVGAAGLALIAARRVGRLVIGLVLTIAGLLSSAATGFFLYDGGVNAALSWAQTYARPGESLFPQRDLTTAPAILACGGGAIAVGIGLFIVLSSRRWPVMGARYERTRGTTPSSDRSPSPVASESAGPAGPLSETAMWAAMDRGEDPTETGSGRYSGDAG